MGNPVLLHTHSIMALLLAILSGSMFVYLIRLKEDVTGKKWVIFFYGAQIVWQFSDMVRYSLNPALFGSLIYQITVIGLTIPAFCVVQTAYLQFLYRFLDDTFPRGRKILLYVMVVLSLITLSVNIWNEIYNHSTLIILHSTAFLFGLFANIANMIVCFSKTYYLRKTKPEVARGNYYMGVVNILYVSVAIIALSFGFYSPIGYWSFFVMIWTGNLITIVVFINFGALPTSFQTKLVGFNFIIVMSVLMLVALIFFPPLPPNEILKSFTQQEGLIKLILIMLFAMMVIQLFSPYILKKTLTLPLQRLLTGVQQINSGDLTTKVQIGQPDEIGDLTQNFNRMTETIKKAQDDLKNYAESLEQQVTERTAEVVKQNKQIETQRDNLQKTLENLKSTQNQLVQKEKLASLGELTAGIAHEIQNPLNFVNNFSELSVDLVKDVNEEIGKETIDKDYVKILMSDLTANQEKIKHHGKRASSIVKGMLEHSQASTGERTMTDINKLADEYLRLSFHGLRAKDKNFNSDYKTDFDETIPKLNVVPQDIGRVLLNLINNAFYAVNEEKKTGSDTDYEPTVIVSTKKIGDTIEVKVKDNGIGIPDKIKEKIFNPFFTTKPTGEGNTGLGLSLAFDIVTKGHGGELKVESVEGEGTAFIILLPILS